MQTRPLPLILALVLIAGCKNPLSPTKKVEYLVSGSADRASMTIAGFGGSTQQYADRALPWSYTFDGLKGDFVYLSAQNQDRSGCVSVEIRINGAYYRSAFSCGAFVIATASGTI